MCSQKVLILFAVIFYLSSTNAIINKKYSVLSDFIKFSYVSPKLLIFSCELTEGFLLQKWFNKNTFIAIVNINRPLPKFDFDNNIVFVLDTACSNFKSILKSANSNNLFRSPYRWVILNENQFQNTDESYQQIKTILSELNILVDSEVTFILCISNAYTIIQAYKIESNSEIIFEHIANWNNGLSNIESERVLAKRRQNLHNLIIKASVVVLNNDTINHLNDYKQREIDTVTKVNYILVQHVATILNITLEYIFDTSWGYPIPNTSEWNGAIGHLRRHEAHICVTPGFMTELRLPIVQYIPKATISRSKFVFRQPKLSYVSNVYDLPFETNVWLSLILLMMLCTLTLYLTVKWENSKLKQLNTYDPQSMLQADLREISFLTFTALCQQGTNQLPFRVPGRIISIFLYLSLMFLYTSYAATILSLLQTPSTTINTLEDLLHSRLELGVLDTIYNRFYFSTYQDTVRKAIYERKVAPPGKPENFLSMNEGISKLRAGLFAFHFEEGAGYKRIQETFYEHEKCGLKEIQYLQVTDPFMFIQKNLPFLEHFKIAYMKLDETGFSNCESSRLYTKKPHCGNQRGGFITVTLIDCYPLAVILSIGFAAAVIIFLVELYAKKCLSFFKNQSN